MTLLLAVDAGNSAVKFGIFGGAQLRCRWVVPYSTGEISTAALVQRLAREGVSAEDLDVALASVGPHRPQLEAVLGQLPGVRLQTLEVNVSVNMPLAYADPSQLGVDRWLNCLAARARFSTAVMVVDVGTATNFECISARGEFVGGAIAAGPQLSLDALSSRSRKLAHLELAAPKRALGNDTSAALQSGAFYGQAALVDGMVTRLAAELEAPVTVIGTGGYMEQLAPECTTIDVVDPALTLDGARIAWAHLTGTG